MTVREREVPDEVLVVAAIVGDLTAFDALVGRYRTATVRLAEAIVGPEHAEDVAQDALLLAFQALPSIDDPARFGPWLRQICRHRALRSAKQSQRRDAGRVALDEVLLNALPALSQPLPEGEGDSAVREALATLPEAFALPIRLHYYDDMPLARIGAFLGVPESTIKWRLYKGRHLLRARLHQVKEMTHGTRARAFEAG